MEGDLKAAVEAVEQERTTRNRGIGLCLSGGGFRATLFHLGAIQRLFELGTPQAPTSTPCPEGRLRARLMSASRVPLSPPQSKTMTTPLRIVK